ncbi:ExeM/NucH family extracellular endonuclease [Cupriavidus basilensis]|uniref:ExeM/NucH family extracellular endonuclease n=1 Tax=Cupriavidus basilensis TaxID=68895 RepID=UPI0020C66334|nr:ExeM/NucH family extracellular endonuclease [Cupriavidus basilensis]
MCLFLPKPFLHGCLPRILPPCLAWLCFALPAHADAGYRDQARALLAPPTAQCGAPATLIANLRDESEGTPSIGRRVALEAVVTADYSGTDGLSGFFVQQADAQRQRRPGVSEGMFVHAPRAAARAGDLVRVLGTVEERAGQMRLRLSGPATVCAAGQAVTPETITLPTPHTGSLAAYEGMLVRLPQTLTVSETFELGRYGSVVLSLGRPPLPTNVALPGEAAAAQAAANALNRLVLDDGYSRQNPPRVIHPAPGLSASNTLRSGDSVANVRGVLEWRANAWRIQPLPGAPLPAFQPTNPRGGAPARAARTDLRVAAFNVENYFNGDGRGAGFDDPGNRGAKSPAEFARQEAKILSALQGLNADVIGLMEIENNGHGELSAIHRLAGKLGPDWRFIHPGREQLGGDVIKVALVYNSRTVEPVGTPATLALGARTRQPLAATFRLPGHPAKLTVVVNHFKSKRCNDARGVNADQRDGQSCWNPTRVAAASRIADWLATSPTGVPDDGKLVIGDLNSYAQEDPIRLLAERGYADMIARFAEAGTLSYSYVFGGEAGYIDHALADAGAASRTLAARHWHINADEPISLAYALAHKSEAQQQSFYAPDAYRSSDHDPLVVDLAMRGDGVATGGTAGTAGTAGTDGSAGSTSTHTGTSGGSGANASKESIEKAQAGAGATDPWLLWALAGATALTAWHWFVRRVLPRWRA